MKTASALQFHILFFQSEVEKKPEPKHSVTKKMKFLQEQSSNQGEQKRHLTFSQ